MVEANRNTDAVFMISELAKLLRISLSKGRTVIRIADEIQHSTSYMNIQKVRYKERFATEFIIDEEINDYCTVKLIVQPILENAIYYGVGNMDEDDGGKITVRVRRRAMTSTFQLRIMAWVCRRMLSGTSLWTTIRCQSMAPEWVLSMFTPG